MRCLSQVSAVSWRGRADEVWQSAGVAALVSSFEVFETLAAGVNQPEAAAGRCLGCRADRAGGAPLVVRRQMPIVVLAETTGITVLYWLPVFSRRSSRSSALSWLESLAAWLTLAIGSVAFAWLPTLFGLEPLPTAAAMLHGATGPLCRGAVRRTRDGPTRNVSVLGGRNQRRDALLQLPASCRRSCSGAGHHNDIGRRSPWRRHGADRTSVVDAEDQGEARGLYSLAACY
jgi:hypothetical protein